MQPTSILVTASGRNRPGILGALLAAMAAHDVEILDLEQVVVRDRLMLAALIDLRGDTAALRNSVTRAAQALGMDCDVTLADRGGARPRREWPDRCHVILLGHPLRPGSISDIADRVGEAGGSIESITQIATGPVGGLELIVNTAGTAALCAELIRAAHDTGLEVAVQPAGLRRRAKRMVVLDLDSTVLADDPISLLAHRAGNGAQDGEIAARAVAGKLDAGAALRARVALLAGLAAAELAAARDQLRPALGAARFVRALRWLGYRVGSVSGGCTAFTDRFVTELGLDAAVANHFEIRDGRLTGALIDPVIDRQGKARALQRLAGQFGVPLPQTVAVGEGADDIDLLSAAGLGIAVNAKAARQSEVEASQRLPYFDSVLFVLGLCRTEADRAGLADQCEDTTR